MTATLSSNTPIIRYHLRRDDLTPFDVLSVPNTARVFWAEPGSSQIWAGIGCETRLTAAGPERFHAIRRAAQPLLASIIDLSEPPLPGYLPRLFGGFAFSDHPAIEMWAGFPPAEFILPRIQVLQTHGETWITVNHRLRAGEKVETVQNSLEREAQGLRPQHLAARAVLLETTDKVTFFQWQKMVNRATQSIKAGKIQKVVLSRIRAARFATAIDPLPALKTLGRAYPQTFRFLFSPRPGQAFFGATPELLARVHRPQVYSLALAGSAARGRSPMQQKAFASHLLESVKDRHEHSLVVDAIRNALHPLTSELHAADTPHIRRLANIQHLETQIHGTLLGDFDIYDVTLALHPTAAVGGAPRQAALEFVRQAESAARGWYAAPIGWLDAAGDGVFAVAIRSALCDGDRAHLYAGAGIVAGSDPVQEWQETELKFKPLMEALGG